MILLHGLDRDSYGSSQWRRRVTLVPQFQENHVLLGSFAFNALLGRGWPPTADDAREMQRVCVGLGLGPLLARMPGRALQLVGETGWQLSHGERSRLFVARALLQRPDVLILDESFGALDPATLRATMDFVLQEARTVVVVAHR
jgi:ATP-binding cassette subfamily B protein